MHILRPMLRALSCIFLHDLVEGNNIWDPSARFSRNLRAPNVSLSCDLHTLIIVCILLKQYSCPQSQKAPGLLFLASVQETLTSHLDDILTYYEQARRTRMNILLHRSYSLRLATLEQYAYQLVPYGMHVTHCSYDYQEQQNCMDTIIIVQYAYQKYESTLVTSSKTERVRLRVL